MRKTDHRSAQSTTYRMVTYAFGVLFVALGVAIFVVADLSMGTIVAGILLGGLGLDAVVSAILGKKSLLAWIGPLP